MHEPSDPEPNASPARRSRRSAWVGVLLALAATAIALVATGALDPSPGSTPEDVGASDPAGSSRLRPHTMEPKPIPAGAVEIVVVERGAGPVEGVELRLSSSLSSTDDGERGLSARTDGEGRARFEGTLPGFLEVVSDAWAAEPPVRAIEGGRQVVVEVEARPPFRTVLVEGTSGIGVADWRLGTVAVRADDTRRGVALTASTDGRGAAMWPAARRRPAILAATDGKRRVHAFFLEVPAGRTEAVLEVPPVERTSRVRVLDAARRPLPGARVGGGSEGAGIAFETDANGEVELDHGGRAGLPLTVTAPGFVARSVRIEGDRPVEVVLAPTGARTFRLRRADGGEVEDGARLRVLTRGPTYYGPEAPGLDVGGTCTNGTVVVEGLPATAFDARVAVTGPGLLSLARIAAGDDPTTPIDVLAAPPRTLTVRVAAPASDGESAAVGLLWVRATGGPGCAASAADGWLALSEAVRAGGSDDPFGALVVRSGPEWTLDVPASPEPRFLEMGSPEGTYACLAVGPADAAGVREARLVHVPGEATGTPSPVRVEWATGGAAELLPLEVRRDENGAPASPALTDSSGLALLRLLPGRYVLAAELPDGTRFEGDGPLLLPTRGTPVIRLRPAGR